MNKLLTITFLLASICANGQKVISADTLVDEELGKKYVCTFTDNKQLTIKNSTGEIIFSDTALYAQNEEFNSLQFIDFNEDNHKDILIHYLSNTPAICDLILYDNYRKKFVTVEGFPDYPASKKIKGTDLYYSYHRSGCADMNWDSDLFYFNEFKPVRIANISGRECDNEDEKKGLFVYKTHDTTEVLYKSLPIPEFGEKWNFIADYWSKNWRTFLPNDKQPIETVDRVFNNFIKHSEYATDSKENLYQMEKSLLSLQSLSKVSDLPILLNVWMYYDPTDFQARNLINPILHKDKAESIKAIDKRLKEKKNWENTDTAPYSDLIALREQLSK